MKRILKILAILAGIVIVVAVALPFFVDANTFRPKLESELSAALGRQVKVGNLTLSLFSGGVEADNISIADDPGFSKSPFVQAKSLKVGVEMIPLIFSKALHVTDLTLNQPAISLVRSENGEKWNFSSLGNASSGGATAEPTAAAPVKASQPAPGANSNPTPAGHPDLSVAKLNVNNGRLTVSQAGTQNKPRVYDKVNVEVNNFSFTNSFPFQVTAELPAGGSLKLEGKAGPIDASNAALTPLQAKVSIKQMNLAASGFIDPASGIAGIADFDGTIASDGHEVKTDGTLKVEKLQVVQKGSPAGKPVQVQYAVTHNLAKSTGMLNKGAVSMGKAVANLGGSYDAHGAITSVNMKLSGHSMPVDDLEAMLPALGVVLPPKATLKGGVLNVDLATVGPVNKLVTTGTIRLENSELAGFNLGSKMSAISALSGKNTGGNDTVIQNFSSDVHVAPDGTRAENINLTIPTFGVLTGTGTVSPANELNFKMVANLSGSAVTGVTQMAGLGSQGGSVPFFVQGTTSDPKFVPDVKGMASGVLQGVLGNKTGQQGQQDPVSGIVGLFKKKKPK